MHHEKKSLEEIQEVLSILEKTYPEARCELNHENPFQLLIATILSAQTTDKKVNEVTADLFSKYQTPENFLQMTPWELEERIREIGLYRSKAANILKTCRILVEEYHSQIPAERAALMKLPGVGRKTANVVLSNAFGVPAIAVDTHVFRVSNRLGLAKSAQVVETEEQLMKAIPEDQWSSAHHLLIFHGRRICVARNPKCGMCPLKQYCQYYAEAKSLSDGR